MSILTSLDRVAFAGMVLLAATGQAMAIPAAGVTSNNTLVTFDTSNPSTLTSGPTAITGLVAGDTLLDIDLRPSAGLVYALGKGADNSGRLYTLNTATAAATLVATLAADPADVDNPFTALSGVDFGIDFNPVVDRLRVVSNTGQNLRINPNNGLVITDSTLNYAPDDSQAGGTPSVTTLAYTNSYSGAGITALYGLDFANLNARLVLQNPPNSGTLNTVAPTILYREDTANGFDIAPNNTAFVTLTVPSAPNASYLWQINIATGEVLTEFDAFVPAGAPINGFTLLPSGFLPNVTNTTTPEDTQSTSGLVITPDASDSVITTHFKITGIKNGTLYLNDGKTVVPNGSFITKAQGAAGLKFTPTPDVYGVTSFDVQSSTSNTDAGLIGNIVSAGIIITSVNDAPTVTSVTPQNATDKVGQKRTFSVTISDKDGTAFLGQVWLLINDRLGWGSGATLIYRPNLIDPTKGTITLRRGDTFLPAVQIGANADPKAVLDNGAVRVLASEVTASTNNNSLTLNIPATIRDGLVGTNTLFAYVADAEGATDPAALPGDNGFRRFGNYTVKPQFSGDVNTAPTLGKLSPGATNTTLNGSGIAPGAQTFAFSASDADGLGDLDTLLFIAGKNIGFKGNATFLYEARTRRLYLRSNDGGSWLGGVQVGQPGTAGLLENAQVRVDLSKVKVSIGGDGKTLALSIPLQAKSGLVGANKVWLRVQDKSGATAPDGDAQGYVLKGTWNVKASSAEAAPGSVPSGGDS